MSMCMCVYERKKKGGGVFYLCEEGMCGRFRISSDLYLFWEPVEVYDMICP